MIRRALWREYTGIQWHLHNLSWEQFLHLSIADRVLQRQELNAIIDRHNEESGAPPDD